MVKHNGDKKSQQIQKPSRVVVYTLVAVLLIAAGIFVFFVSNISSIWAASLGLSGPNGSEQSVTRYPGDRPGLSAKLKLTPLSLTSTPIPMPNPIVPFPMSVQAQVAVLQAHNRFFYSGNTARPEVALTFDDGPDPVYTTQILDILKKYNIKATFFDVGHHVEDYPDLVRREYDEGHCVGNHSWTHDHLSRLSLDDIYRQLNATSNSIEKVTGQRPLYFRPPFGDYSSSVLTQANRFGLTTFMWNDMPSDWLLPGSQVIAQRVLYQAHNGSIILLHDGDGDHYTAVASRQQTVDALPIIIEQLQARGFKLVSLAQMMADLHK